MDVETRFGPVERAFVCVEPFAHRVDVFGVDGTFLSLAA
jgi:hypothetical protein